MHISRRHAANFASTIVVGLCAVVYYKTSILQAIPLLRGGSDFGVYYRAAQDILTGKSPYENPAYFYPPSVAFLMAPFALTSYVSARWIWFAMSHVLLLSAAWLLWRAMGRGRIALCCIACVWALGGAAKETLEAGQLSPLLVLVLVLAYTRRARLQGIFVGIGFALKYIPGVLGVPLLLRRQWRALWNSLAVTAMAVMIPWLVLWRGFSGARAPTNAHYWMGTPAMFSWSLPSVALRILEPLAVNHRLPQNWEFGNVAETLHLGLRLELISAGIAIATLVLGMAALAMACRGRLALHQVPWAMIALVSLSLAAAPVCWTHYQILQYPGAAMLLASAFQRRAWFTAAMVVVCFALLYQLPQAALLAYYQSHAGWTAAAPATLYLWTSVAPFACLGLFSMAIANVRRLGPRATARQERLSVPVLHQRREREAATLSLVRRQVF